MKIVFGGNFESAFIRMHDEHASPSRNQTQHPYYMDLNRNTNKIYRDGASTFAALAEAVRIPWELDWNEGEIAKNCGVVRTARTKEDRDWQVQYHIIDDFIEEIIKENVLSSKSILHITNLDMSGYSDEVASMLLLKNQSDYSKLIEMYLRRLLHQIYAAHGSGVYLLVAEPELQIIVDLGKFLATGRFQHKIPFPDMRDHLIDTETLLGGVLAFSPYDIFSLEAVRANPEVRQYAQHVIENLKEGDVSEFTRAAVEAYRHTEAGKSVDRIFEILSWVVKPLHYIPAVGQIMTVVEDVKDAGNEVTKWKTRYSDWHMIGVRMQTISAEEYFKRQSNRFPDLGSDRP